MASFDIYQLKDIPENREIRFTDTAMLKKLKIAKIEDIHVSRYDHMYSDEFKAGMSLYDIFRRFNIERPADFKGHSLSVSDVIVVHPDKGKPKAYYVDCFDFFPELKGFLSKAKDKTPTVR